MKIKLFDPQTALVLSVNNLKLKIRGDDVLGKEDVPRNRTKLHYTVIKRLIYKARFRDHGTPKFT